MLNPSIYNRTPQASPVEYPAQITSELLQSIRRAKRRSRRFSGAAMALPESTASRKPKTSSGLNHGLYGNLAT
jgi:hypothetical protein